MIFLCFRPPPHFRFAFRLAFRFACRFALRIALRFAIRFAFRFVFRFVLRVAFHSAFRFAVPLVSQPLCLEAFRLRPLIWPRREARSVYN